MTIATATALLDLDAVVLDGTLSPRLLEALLTQTRQALEAYPLIGIVRPGRLERQVGAHARARRRLAAAAHAVLPDKDIFPSRTVKICAGSVFRAGKVRRGQQLVVVPDGRDHTAAGELVGAVVGQQRDRAHACAGCGLMPAGLSEHQAVGRIDSDDARRRGRPGSGLPGRPRRRRRRPRTARRSARWRQPPQAEGYVVPVARRAQASKRSPRPMACSAKRSNPATQRKAAPNCSR